MSPGEIRSLSLGRFGLVIGARFLQKAQAGFVETGITPSLRDAILVSPVKRSRVYLDFFSNASSGLAKGGK
jgi:hypothetical protein